MLHFTLSSLSGDKDDKERENDCKPYQYRPGGSCPDLPFSLWLTRRGVLITTLVLALSLAGYPDSVTIFGEMQSAPKSASKERKYRKDS